MIDISPKEAQFLDNLLKGELQRRRAVVDIERLRKQGNTTSAPAPLCERLGEYPADPVDLENIVVYPPRLQAIPVKPTFLDIAFNYIDYPDKGAKGRAAAPAEKAAPGEQKPQKRGWFGFGR